MICGDEHLISHHVLLSSNIVHSIKLPSSSRLSPRERSSRQGSCRVGAGHCGVSPVLLVACSGENNRATCDHQDQKKQGWLKKLTRQSLQHTSSTPAQRTGSRELVHRSQVTQRVLWYSLIPQQMQVHAGQMWWLQTELAQMGGHSAGQCSLSRVT